MDSSIGAVEDSTAKHLPECPQLTEKPDWYCCEDCDPGVWDDCICDRLRACEQRVLTEFVARIQDRMTDSDLDNIVSDDGKDLIWAAIDALREEQK